ncbi:MAG: hypothetical protein PHY08_14465, partial [Candidatus Cloacimonetes bacterium]|nr:hypothetical protein [Candidatus Cloacimonadota bacterium]
MKKVWCLVCVALISFCLFSLHAQIDPKQEKVLIAGVGKDIAFALPYMIPKIESLGTQFADYRVIIYQNNSVDNTEQLLLEWAYKNSKIIIVTETLSEEALYMRTKAHTLKDNAPCRMELIAHGRNEVLKRSWAQEFDGYSYLIMSDLDFTVGWEVAGVLSCFTYDEPWDAMTANGVRGHDNYYYDRYAFRDATHPFGPDILRRFFWKDLEQNPLKFASQDPLHRVYSAFGGIAVYRREALKGCWYSGLATDEYKALLATIIDQASFKKSSACLQYKKSRGL